MQFIYVFLGGGIGAMCRYGIAKILPNDSNSFPTATLMANVISCLILGYILGYFMNKSVDYKVQLFLITGFCGGFSTFSTFTSETFKLLNSNHLTLAFLNIIGSVIVCLLCFWIGIRISGRL